MSASYFDSHVQVKFYLTPEDRARLHTILKGRSMSLHDWMLTQILHEEKTRLPDSKGGVRRDVPIDLAIESEALWWREAQSFRQLAEHQPSSSPQAVVRRREYLSQARHCEEMASWFGDSVVYAEDLARRIETGQIVPRQRSKSASVPDLSSEDSIMSASSG